MIRTLGLEEITNQLDLCQPEMLLERRPRGSGVMGEIRDPNLPRVSIKPISESDPNCPKLFRREKAAPDHGRGHLLIRFCLPNRQHTIVAVSLVKEPNQPRDVPGGSRIPARRDWAPSHRRRNPSAQSCCRALAGDQS